MTRWLSDKWALLGFLATIAAIDVVVMIALVVNLASLRLARRWREQRHLDVVEEVTELTEYLRIPAPNEPTRPSPLLHHTPQQPATRLRVSRPVLALATAELPAVAEVPLADPPIFVEVAQEWDRRRRALTMPTTEMRGLFDVLAAEYLCSHCEDDDCDSCPGCSCPCRVREMVGAA